MRSASVTRMTLAVALAASGLAACGSDSTSSSPAASGPAASGPAASGPAQSGASGSPSARAQGDKPRSFTLVATGDPLLHEAWWIQAQLDAARTGKGEMDFIPAIDSTEKITRGAGLALCHMETVLAKEGGPYSGYPAFNSPPQIVAAMKDQGYDVCTTASNHSLDQGAAGIKRLLDYLDEADIQHVGTARDPEEAATPVITEVDTPQGPVQVANINYTYSFNGIPLPEDKPWLANEINLPKILADAKEAKESGAEVVVLTMHWGTEYLTEANDEQKAQARELLASPDIDIIIGGHAHVVQPIEKIGDKWVTYGHGNLFGCHLDPGTAKEEGLLTRFTFTEKPDGGFTTTKAEYLPLLGTCSETRAKPYRVMNIPQALEEGEYGVYGRARLEKAAKRTEEIVNSMGAEADGLELLDQ